MALQPIKPRGYRNINYGDPGTTLGDINQQEQTGQIPPGYGNSPASPRTLPNALGGNNPVAVGPDGKPLPRPDAYLTEDLSEDNPLPWQKYVDEDAQNFARNAQYQRYDPLSGVGGTNVSQAKALGAGQSSPMSLAIARKYQGDVDRNLSGLRLGESIAQPLEESKRKSKVADYMSKVQAIRQQNFKEQWDFQQKRVEMYNNWQAQKDMAKAQFISSMVGGGLALAGYVGGAGTLASTAGVAAGAGGVVATGGGTTPNPQGQFGGGAYERPQGGEGYGGM